MKIFEKLLSKEIIKATGGSEDSIKKINVFDDTIEHAENEIKELENTKKSMALELINILQYSDLVEIKKYFDNNIIYDWFVNIPDEKGLTALMIASNKGFTEVVETLLDCGADVNYKTEKGFTALFLAAFGGNLSVVETLIKNGAEISCTNDGISPLDIAWQGNHEEVEKFLIKVSPPEEAKKYVDRGVAKFPSDITGAIVDFTKAIGLNPKLCYPYYYRGVSKSMLKDPQGAIEDFNIAIELKSDYAIAYTSRGMAKSTMGDKLGACKDWEYASALGEEKAKQLIQLYCKQ